MLEALKVALPVFLGLCGLWLGSNFRLQARKAFSSQISAAYSELWEITQASSPDDENPITDEAARAMALSLAQWYFRNGNGMYMPSPTRRMLFAIIEASKGNVENIQPTRSRQYLQKIEGEKGRVYADLVRACLIRRQVSRLRTQVKRDIATYLGRTSFSDLRKDEIDFLQYAQISYLPIAVGNLWRRVLRRLWGVLFKRSGLPITPDVTRRCEFCNPVKGERRNCLEVRRVADASQLQQVGRLGPVRASGGESLGQG